MTPRVDVWEESVGFLPWKVTAHEELARKRIVYLRWRQDGNWRRLSLKRGVRTPRGRLDPVAVKWALEQASAQYARLVAGVPLAERAPTAPLTLAKGLAAAIHAETGKYPTKTPHRKEVEREMKRAIAALGDVTWESITKADLRKLWRGRIQALRAEEEKGLRGAEITIARVLAVAAWLRDEELIPVTACIASRKWKEQLRADWLELTKERALPTPERPRHTLEEMRKIMAVAWQVDPRFELIMALGAELRLGQLLRCRRPDLDLEHRTLTVPGRKGKKGVVSKLTNGQMAVVERALGEGGYLSKLEHAAADYPLFPGLWRGKDVAHARYASAKPLGHDVLDDWFHRAEDLAEVPRIKGGGAYTLRRAAVDAAKAMKISREGLQQQGGWADTQMPDQIYADQEADYAREEARDVRAKIRGEE